MAKRRLNGEGTIVRHKTMGWMAQLTYEGKRKTVYGKTQKEVQGKLRQLRTQQELGIPIPANSISIKKYLHDWLEIKRRTVRPGTYDGYESMVRAQIIPRFGHHKLDKISTEQIARTLTKMSADGCSAYLIWHVHTRLGTAFNDAVKRGLINRNPMEFLAKPALEHKEMHTLENSQQMIRLLENAQSSSIYSVIHTALHTGLRRNELLGLQWKDIDTYEAVIYLSRSLYHAKGGKTIFQQPKTRSGKRSVPLPPASAIHLRDLRKQQEIDGDLYGYKVTDDSLVFRLKTGDPLLPNTVSHAFRRIANESGLTTLRFHDLRHTHASMMLKQGVHPKVVQERLGHAKISTTMDTYSHVTASLHKDAAKSFDLALETVD